MIKLDNENKNSYVIKQLKKDLKYVQNCLSKLEYFNKRILKYVNNISNEDNIELNNNMEKIYKNFFTSNYLLKESLKLKKEFNSLKNDLDSFFKIESFTTSSFIEKINTYNAKAKKASKGFLNFKSKTNKFLKDFDSIVAFDYKNFKENTLIISETTRKIILPYSIDEIKNILKKEKDKFNSPEEVINELYTIPIKKYKNSALSRFKEAYKIVRERSNGTRKEALDLALELLTNYKLHPAIITACKNIHELDVYLSCLEYDELEDFRFFDIIYEIPPAIS